MFYAAKAGGGGDGVSVLDGCGWGEWEGAELYGLFACEVRRGGERKRGFEM